MSTTRAPLAVLLLLAVAFVAVTAAVTPWRALPAGTEPVAVDVARDFTPDEAAPGSRFRAELRVPTLLGAVVALAAALVLGLTPLGAAVATWATRPGGPWALRVAMATIALAALLRLATLPTSAWARSISRRNGLSTQSWTGWLADVLRAWAVTTTLLVVALVVLVGLARRLPDHWWILASALAALTVVVASFAFPLVVEPLFNRFTPMPDSPLRTSLIELAERDGVPVDDVLVADASRRTTALNAYVSGFGSTRRIVVFDTLLERASPEEVELVVAHELGHAERNDVLTGTLIGALGAAMAVCALFLVLRDDRLLALARADGASDVRVIALVLAFVAVVGVISTPVQGLISRRLEARADVHALDLTRDPETFIAMQRRLALVNRSDLEPPVLLHTWFGTHPTTPERIALARTWARSQGVDAP